MPRTWPALVVGLCLIAPTPGLAATFVVNTLADAVDASPGDGSCATSSGVCTLRAAIQEANSLGGSHFITLPAGAYVLTIPGIGEADAATGDLNITASITIDGDVAATTIIDAASLDRVFQAFGPASLTLSDVTLQNGNPASGLTGMGGAIYMGAGTRLTLLRTVIRANTSNGGGGIFMFGDGAGHSVLTIADSTIAGNTSMSHGGGLLLSGNSDATVTLHNVTFSDNTAGATGGGLYLAATANTRVENVAVVGNTALLAGGAWIASDIAGGLVSRTTVSRNTSTLFGGGLVVDGPSTLANVTISGNISGGAGGAIYQITGALALINVTIALNSSASSGAIVANAITAKNTIIANSAGVASVNCLVAGTLTDLGHNLEFPGLGCGFGLPSDRRADPLLGVLGSYGGSTQTHSIKADSPAFNAGDDATCAAAPVSGVDQRGVARPAGAHCDIGAFEALGGSGFTDDPLVSRSTTIQAIHVTELRTRIDALRARFGLSPASWTVGAAQGMTVRAAHVSELRAALADAYKAAIAAGRNVSLPVYADDPLLPNLGSVRALHVEQLRAAVLVLDGV